MPPSEARVSVVIPHYNDLSGLARALASLRAQADLDFEVVVIDDASTPAVRDDLGALLADCGLPIAGYFHITNLGAAAARNSGLSVASGEFVCLLDSDDLFLPGKIGWARARAAEPGMALLGHRYRDGDGRVVDGRGPLAFVRRWPWWLIAIKNPAPTPTVAFRKDPAIGFDEEFRRFDDQLFLVSYARAHGPAAIDGIVGTCVPKPIIGTGGLSGRFWPMVAAELQFICALPRFGLTGVAIALLLAALLPIRLTLRAIRLLRIRRNFARRSEATG